MKVMIPLNDDKQTLCPSFGRAPCFMLYDSGAKSREIVVNPASEASGGAGIKCAQFIADMGADALITARCGQNAAEVLEKAKIAIYKAEGEKADEILEKFRGGNLYLLDKFHPGFHGLA